MFFFFFFQAEDGIRDFHVTGVQTCALPILRLEGQVREVTILFSDLRDFTPWVESHPPEDVIRDINAYFTLMEGAIRAHGGLVVQFIGDEIEAVFGAPVAEPHHADHAVAAALEMCRRLEEWNESRRA